MSIDTATTPASTLADVVRVWAERTPEADCFVEDTTTWSYRDVAAQAEAVANRFLSHGLEPGSRVCVLTRPSADFGFSLLGALDAGVVWVGLNPKYTAREIAHVLDDAAPELVLFEPALATEPMFRHTMDAAISRGIEAASLRAFVENAHQAPPQVKPEVTAADGAFIVYTSGTTGVPKGAVVSHGAPLIVGTEMHRHLGVRAPRVLNNFPCNHIAGVSEITLSTLIAGGAVVFQSAFDPAEGFDLIARHRVSVWMQVPTMFQLALDDRWSATADLSSVEVIAFGGAAPSAALVRRLREITPKLTNTYGLTETVGGMTWTSLEATDDELISTVGYPLDRFEMRIADDDGNELDPGEVGEVQFRGDYVFSGYFGRDDATAEAFTAEGWMRTGDLGTLDSNGALVLTGRRSQMFKSGGYNVYPLEVEQWLTGHAAVAEAVVVGVRDETFGEVGHAYVQFVDDAELSSDELKDHCREALANYKIPKAFERVESWPTLPNGKIDRNSLSAAAHP